MSTKITRRQAEKNQEAAQKYFRKLFLTDVLGPQPKQEEKQEGK